MRREPIDPDRPKRLLPKNRRLDFDCERSPRSNEIDDAIAFIKHAGVAHMLEEHLARRSDAVSALTVRGLLVATQLVGFARNHKMLFIDVTRILNTLDRPTLNILEMPNWKVNGSYDRVENLMDKIDDALTDGFDCINFATGEKTHVDAYYYANAVIRASVADDLVKDAAIAIDGTDLPTWGAMHTGPDEVELDGEANALSEEEVDTDYDALPDQRRPAKVESKKPTENKRTAKVLGVGADGRKIYTCDTDARAGHRSATNQRNAGSYIGRDVHLGVTVRQMYSKDGVKQTSPGPAVPQLLVTMDVVPAGTHRGKAVIGSLLEAHGAGLCSEVIPDPGYTLMKGETFHHLLQQADIPLIARPASHQRTKLEQVDKPQTVSGALLLDGQFFSKHTPKELLHLEMPPRGCSNEDKQPYIAKFEQRARYAYRRHEKPGADGTTRWKCPFCAGQLRCEQLPHTMRKGRHLPLVELPEGTTRCCDGILRVDADQLPMM